MKEEELRMCVSLFLSLFPYVSISHFCEAEGDRCIIYMLLLFLVVLFLSPKLTA